jgi:hypothetical protein
MKLNPIVLSQFQNRQVIINNYMDGELISRDGFFFDRVHISENEISIIRNDLPLWSFTINNFSFQSGETFKNFYRLVNGDAEIQIYFP